MIPIEEDVFVCIDCETTGLDPINDQIIEVAICVFTFKEILESFESLIDPRCLIPEESTAIHHITQNMVEGKPKIEDVLEKLLSMTGQKTIVGHGIGFDIAILAQAAKKAGLTQTFSVKNSIDTLRLARLYGKSPSNSLEVLRSHFNIPKEGAHRAMSDVIVNIEVFKYLSKNFKTSKKIFEVLSGPIEMKNMPLGKHKGRALKEVPLDYLKWAITKNFDQDLSYSIRKELDKRKKGDNFNQTSSPFSKL